MVFLTDGVARTPGRDEGSLVVGAVSGYPALPGLVHSTCLPMASDASEYQACRPSALWTSGSPGGSVLKVEMTA